MKERQAAFDDKRDERTQDYWEYTSVLKKLREMRAQALTGITCGAVATAAAAILQRPCGTCSKAVVQVRVREVEVVDKEYRCVVKVPVFQCADPACTSAPFSVPPIAAYCAPTTATIDCRKWLTLPVVIEFSELNFSGVSGYGGFSLTFFLFLPMSH
jgi:hypothetical protein